ncbi:winged helix-turn-helix transcriptional regulator [Actinoplanes sp. LDG1-06]|uniref:Winged helix-turn-helix transcriptional regulator n=1 Tax=Paractinoplanes ovalisporus TaxID=2810368 RepID=A0ABS2AJK8_9ACTN|nr:metalloregulator ArsR/SmtB family transcription factor [Actinoplanes ovalisporus]MBM2619985.1 winged helix-turn-helix transcriptional regulator [Actinoplanes ovalisporus]
MDALAAIAEPTRRRIVDGLRLRECTVSELVDMLGMSQPAVSKHLRVLREAGVVSAQTRAQQRVYRLEPGPFRELDAWLAPYRRMWTHHLGELERHLDRKAAGPRLGNKAGPRLDN